MQTRPISFEDQFHSVAAHLQLLPFLGVLRILCTSLGGLRSLYTRPVRKHVVASCRNLVGSGEAESYRIEGPIVGSPQRSAKLSAGVGAQGVGGALHTWRRKNADRAPSSDVCPEL